MGPKRLCLAFRISTLPKKTVTRGIDVSFVFGLEQGVCLIVSGQKGVVRSHIAFFAPKGERRHYCTILDTSRISFGLSIAGYNKQESVRFETNLKAPECL